MKRLFIFVLLIIGLNSSLLYSAGAVEASGEPSEVSCNICFEQLYPLAPSDFLPITTLPRVDDSCGHSFHTNCLARWAARSSTCPECRVPFDNDLVGGLPEPEALDLAYLNSRFDTQRSTLVLYEEGLPTIEGLQNFLQKEAVAIIDLANNSIATVGQGNFRGFNNLIELSFDNNPNITTLEAQAFEGPGNSLEDLSFENCALQIIDPNVFHELSGLCYLNLSNNPIAMFPVGVFTPLVSLEILDLTNLDLSDVEKARIRQEVRAVSPNCRVYFQQDDWPSVSFEMQGGFVHLIFYGGLLSSLSIFNSGIQTLLGLQNYPYKAGVINMDISSNNIDSVATSQNDENPFEGFSQLQKLDLSDNRIDFFEPRILDPLTSLTHLYLHSNRYRNLPVGLFTPLNQLEILTLSTTLPEEERARIIEEVANAAPACQVQFIGEQLEDTDEEVQFEEGVDDHGDSEYSADSDQDSTDGDEQAANANISLLSYDEEPGQ